MPIGLGLYLVAIAFPSLGMGMIDPGPNHIRPFVDVNGLMILIGLASGVMLLHPAAGRRLAALFVALLMPGAAAFLMVMDARGFDVRGCGWFTPVELPMAGHLALLGAICLLAVAVFVREETRTLAREDAWAAASEARRRRRAGIA